MAESVRLDLLDSGAVVFAFDVQGDFQESALPQHKNSANPPEIVRLTKRWTLTNALLTAATSELTFDAWQAFLALLEARPSSTTITAARLVRDPGTLAVVEATLGPPVYQEFKISAWTAQGDQAMPGSLLKSVVAVTLEIEAVRCFPDGNGLVEFDQVRRHSFRNGLQTVELETFLSIIEGGVAGDSTDTAETRIKSLGVLDESVYGGTYAWDTNGDGGVDYELLDVDEQDSRVVTRARGTSRLRQFGIAVGQATPGSTVNEPITVEVETISENGELKTITRASAEGPGALGFVKRWRPTGTVQKEVIKYERANRVATAEWTQVEDDTEDGTPDELKVTVTGGARDKQFVPTFTGPPRIAVGPLLPFQARVFVRLAKRGERPARSAMSFPRLLGSPWIFMPNKSSEDAVPQLVKTAKSESAKVWTREANLVYEAPFTDGALSALDALLQSTGRVTSYFA